MDFGRLKDLVKKLGGLLVFDGDEPTLVVLSYEKFKKLDSSEEIPVSHGNGFGALIASNGIQEDEDTVEKLNQEILALKEEIRQKEEAELLENDQPMEVSNESVDLD